jgi:competence protein ComEC
VRASGWRFALLGGASLGLAAGPFAHAVTGATAPIVLGIASLAGLTVAAPEPSRRAPAWLGLTFAAAAILGLGAGELRLASIDGGALHGAPGSRATIHGFAETAPHHTAEAVIVRVGTSAGRLEVEAPSLPSGLAIGDEVRARGRLRAPRPWETGTLSRAGVAMVLTASSVHLTGAARGGFAGVVDGVRNRAGAALGDGTPGAGAALLRGFVLGEDDGIDAPTVSDFRRSGLAHLLAVSGENVALLALLAAPILGLFGVPLRARLWSLLALIGLYVLVTGAGPSIQRAGAMGAAAVVATLAGRPRSRWYAALLAAFATLLSNPRATGDPGWQLSFAAVLGIMLLARRVSDALLPPPERPASGMRRALAEGAGVTLAAGLATAPLIAVDFGTVSLTTLPANLLALPAVAPVMWMGMLIGAMGQLPGLPVAPVTALAGALAGYIAQVAHWLGSPGWAQVTSPPVALVMATAAAGCLVLLAVLAARGRRRGLRPTRAILVLVAIAAIAVIALAAAPPGGSGPAQPRGPGLRIVFIDVGQGDAILLDPAPGAPILVDGGPHGDGLAAKLRSLGVARLAAAIVTHYQADHAGGIEDLLGTFPVDRLVYGVRVSGLVHEARASGADSVEVAEGSELDSGRLRLELLWPPRDAEAGPSARGQDPNTLALVAVARYRGFAMLLTADAEAEAVPLDPGPLDVLKVAHHGSADAGLGDLLDRTAPGLAVISVGAGNTYGHPTAQTLATLAAHGVPVRRTDLDGNVEIHVTGRGWSVR